jgi:hypothetical protein
MLSTQSTLNPDPTFGAIEAHRQAQADFLDAALAADEIDTSPKAIACRQAIAQLGIDVEQRYADTDDAELAAQEALLSVEPTTIAGAIALLRYASVRSERSWEAQCFRHVADALSKIAARGSGRS